MAGLAARRRAVMFELCWRIAMAPQAEVVKARFGTDLDRRSAAAVTTDAGIAASPIAEVVVALDAIDVAVFIMGKVDRKRCRAPNHRLAQCQRSTRDHQWKKGEYRQADAGN